MKFKLLLVFFMIGTGLTLAQLGKTKDTKEYPLISIHDIQYIDAVGDNGFVPSVHTGDTVRVRGAIMVSPMVDPTSNRTPIMYYGARWGSYIQDTSAQASEGWGGLNVLQNDTTGSNQNTFFDLVDTTNVVELTGVVTTYGQTNELFLLIDPVTPVNIVGNISKRPEPLQLTMTDFMKNGITENSGVKYSGMYVELKNVVSSDRNTSSGGFNINDGDGNSIIVYPQSRYYRLDGNKMPGSTYEPPADGTPIHSIRGIITVYNNTFEILPLYPGDITITATPPTISNVTRDVIQVNTNQAVSISAKVVDLDGTVENVFLKYRVGDGSRMSVEMTKSVTEDDVYTGTIPGISEDSTLVDFYLSASDNDGLGGYFPSDTVKGNYFFQVLDETLKIRDVQYSPFGSDYSGYNNYYVQLTGVITADTSDIPGFGSTPLRVYMQDGNGPWSGILVGTLGSNGADVINLKRGDNVTVTGKIIENYKVTSIDSLTSIVVNSSNNALPEPVVLSTGTIGKNSGGTPEAEQWESVLVKYQNVTVSDDNADGDSGPVSNNYGEIYLDDGSGDTRAELQEGNHHYNNSWDATLADNPSNIAVQTGSTFTEVTGVLFFSYSYYKLVPRKDDDFAGFVVDVKKETLEPNSFSLSQNYPNPFNPSTVINYSVKNENMVTLKVFNILGQEVSTLVSESKPAGKYSVSFNASALSSGIYFYTLQAGDFYQVKKMMLIK